MYSAKRYLLIALSFAICMTVFAAFAPRIAHAVTATLVQVENTSANPVPTPDSATRFEADICDVTGAGSTAAATGYCTGGNKFTVPATTSAGLPVKRLIVDNVSGVCDSFNNNPTDLAILGVQLSGSFPADSVPNGNSATHYVPVMPAAHSYVNAASSTPLRKRSRNRLHNWPDHAVHF